ncbi:MAG: hypothetical protein IPK19_42050 [Chloroflexi bacterium]|nr:hypothetical protein [Chloroflexota bacterium]
MRAEVPAQREADGPDQRRRPADSQRPSRQQIGAQRRPEDVADGADPHRVGRIERGNQPVGWVERADLRVGQQRRAHEQVGSPQRQTAGAKGFGADLPVGVVVAEGVAARHDPVREGQAVIGEKRQRQEGQRNKQIRKGLSVGTCVVGTSEGFTKPPGRILPGGLLHNRIGMGTKGRPRPSGDLGGGDVASTILPRRVRGFFIR